MKLFAFRGIRVLVDPILIVLLAVAALLGVGRDMVLMFAFVFGHELCHTLMAIALGVEIDEIELLPFGGVARARGMDRVVGWREVLIALVGPLFNFLCAWCCLMAAKLWPQFAPALLTPVYLNLTMGCFNLLPAFPLDGGRILRSLLSSFLGRERATDVCAVIGVALGAGLSCFGIWGVLSVGRVNPLLISIGVFIILNALREKRRWALGAVTNLEEKRQIIRRGAMEESWITAGKEVSLWEIARRFHKNRYPVVRVVDERMRPLGTVYEDRILDCILRGEREKTLGELVRSG